MSSSYNLVQIVFEFTKHRFKLVKSMILKVYRLFSTGYELGMAKEKGSVFPSPILPAQDFVCQPSPNVTVTARYAKNEAITVKLTDAPVLEFGRLRY